MRIFVLSALPASPIAATNGATPKPNARDSKTPADNSPFAVMLAATAPASQKQGPESQRPDIKDANSAKSIIKDRTDKNQPVKKQPGNDQPGPMTKEARAEIRPGKNKADARSQPPAASSRQSAQTTAQDSPRRAPSAKEGKQDDAAADSKSVKAKDAANDNDDSSAVALNSTQAPVLPQPDPSQLPVPPPVQPELPPQQAGSDSAANPEIGAVDLGSAAPQFQDTANIPAPAPAQDAVMPSTPDQPEPSQAQQVPRSGQAQAAPQPAGDDDDADGSGDNVVAADPASGKAPAPASQSPAQLPPQAANPALLAALKSPSRAGTTPPGKTAASNTPAKTGSGNKPSNDLPAPAADKSAGTPPPPSPTASKSAVMPAEIRTGGDSKSVPSDTVQAGNEGAKDAPAPSLPTPPPPTPPVQTAPAQQMPGPSNPAAVPLTSAPIAEAHGNGIAVPSLHLAAQPTPNVESLAVSIAARSQSGAKQFDIRLDPPELGRVEVRLSIDASGKAQAHMTADHPDTLNLLQKDSGSLTQALRDAGLNVARDGLNFSLRGQSNQSGAHNGGQNGGAGRRTSLSASHVIDSIQNASHLSLTGAAANASLDIHV